MKTELQKHSAEIAAIKATGASAEVLAAKEAEVTSLRIQLAEVETKQKKIEAAIMHRDYQDATTPRRQ